MDKRTAFILDFFANWAHNCKTQYTKIEKTHQEARKDLDALKAQAIVAYQEGDAESKIGIRRVQKDKYIELIMEVLVCHDNTTIFLIHRDRSTRFIKKWERIWGELPNALDDKDDEKIMEIVDCDFKILDMLKDDELHTFDKDKILSLLKKIEAVEKKKLVPTWEKIGKIYAKDYLRKLVSPKETQGRKKVLPDNVDSYRAFQMLKIIQDINSVIKTSYCSQGWSETNIREFLKLVLGQTDDLTNYRNKEIVDWGMQHYFLAKNITSKRLRNSISLGKKELAKFDLLEMLCPSI